MKVLWRAVFALFVAAPALAAESACPPDALGVSRVLEVGTQGGATLGLKSYPQTLPLNDREIVLTFDDGPDAAATPRILDALAKECVKATFFLIGRNAAANPALAKREHAEGHTIAHHSFSHPPQTLRGMTPAAARADLVKGMAAVDKAVYGGAIEGAPRTPFFRFPGFADSPALIETLGQMNVATFGTDFWASDWQAMSPQKQLDLVMARLEEAGRGIVLFHDTKAQTADMLPNFLRELKTRGYRVVHIVPGPGRAETAAAASGWRSETEAILEKMGYRVGATPKHAAKPKDAPKAASQKKTAAPL
jgi:peptidoglycan/xylan/chitin deacetylase (PgdA/CDA1 family)